MRLLIIKNDGMGDLVLALPVLASLSQKFDRIDIICKTDSAGVLPKNDTFKKIIINKDFYITIPNLRGLSLLRKIIEVIKFLVLRPTKSDQSSLESISDVRYDMAIVLRRYIRQSTLHIMQYVNAEKKYCFWQYPTNISNYRASQLTRGWTHIKGDSKVIHERDYYCNVLKRCGYEVAISENRSLKRANNGIALILGNIKRGLTTDNIDSILRRIAHLNRPIYIFGGKDTAKEVKLNQWVKKYNVIDYSGVMTLEEGEAEISANVSHIIGNDTGFMHYVAHHNKSMLIFASSETPERFFPWPGSTNQIVVRKQIACADCGYCKFHKRYCMEYTAEDISKHIELFLNGEKQERLMLETKRAWRWE